MAKIKLEALMTVRVTREVEFSDADELRDLIDDFASDIDRCEGNSVGLGMNFVDDTAEIRLYQDCMSGDGWRDDDGVVYVDTWRGYKKAENYADEIEYDENNA